MLAKTMADKYVIRDACENEYSKLQQCQILQELVFPLEETTMNELETLRPESGTGPDELPARILKECASQLAKPLTFLIYRIMGLMAWPQSWREHWIIPLYKEEAVSAASKYRGVHLTARISKVVERVIKSMMANHIDRTIAFGPNQFAYSKKRGARDALACLMVEWISTLISRGES